VLDRFRPGREVAPTEVFASAPVSDPTKTIPV
jgi:hypothetical protein